MDPAGGCSPEQLGIDPHSRLGREAAKEAWRCHRAEVIDARNGLPKRHDGQRRPEILRRFLYRGRGSPLGVKGRVGTPGFGC
jgi:hypothetical protein